MSRPSLCDDVIVVIAPRRDRSTSRASSQNVLATLTDISTTGATLSDGRTFQLFGSEGR
jgi:hypothetical protein